MTPCPRFQSVSLYDQLSSVLELQDILRNAHQLTVKWYWTPEVQSYNLYLTSFPKYRISITFCPTTGYFWEVKHFKRKKNHCIRSNYSFGTLSSWLFENMRNRPIAFVVPACTRTFNFQCPPLSWMVWHVRAWTRSRPNTPSCLPSACGNSPRRYTCRLGNILNMYIHVL